MLSECSQNRPPYCTFSGLGDCPNKIILPFPSPEEVPTLVYERIARMDYLRYGPLRADTETTLFTAIPGHAGSLNSRSGIPHSPGPLPVGALDLSPLLR